MLRVYNTLTRNKEPFEPITSDKKAKEGFDVGIYLCGPTVYKPSHIGHMVGPVIFDAIKRYLVYSGYKVKWIVNITDVDDKLIAESNQRGMPMAKLAEEMTADYMNNIAALGVDTIDAFPRCTDTIDEIIKMTETLVKKGFAYEAQGDVYFEVAKSPDYGKLSHRGVEAMRGEGGGMADRKRSSADFALWKSAKPGEPSWPSPWGNGRPGWHIECSAMSRKLLGESFDIHGGGLDLMFPHHENEVAQSECCHGKPMAKYWLHNGLMQASSEVGKVGGRNTRPTEGDLAAQEVGKISKSKGSAPFRDLLKQFSGETIRFFVLSTQYRRPIDYSEERLKEIETGMETFYRFFDRYKRVTGKSFYDVKAPGIRCELIPDSERDWDYEHNGDPFLLAVLKQCVGFRECMNDDFNTGGAIGALFELVRALNKFADSAKLDTPEERTSESLAKFEIGVTRLREYTATLGLFRKAPEEKAPGGDNLAGKLMKLLIQLRADARKKKDFATADQIRNTLTEIGVTLEDRPGGTEWTVK